MPLRYSLLQRHYRYYLSKDLVRIDVSLPLMVPQPCIDGAFSVLTFGFHHLACLLLVLVAGLFGFS